MTPAARLQTAIEILDEVFAGKAAEQALTGWARRSRFAGSKDRAAIRDHVFDALRCKSSFAATGGSMSGRGLVLGLVLQAGIDPDTVFCDRPYAPQPLTDAEKNAVREPETDAEALDIPAWLWPRFRDSLGDQAEAAAIALKSRAPLHLRVNTAKCSVQVAASALEDDGILTNPHPAATSALEVVEGARRVRLSNAYESGLVELQDAASQAVVETLPLRPGKRVLDYCAGGGGKALAIAANEGVQVFAYDIAPKRMEDLPDRAGRAGATITILNLADLKKHGPFDLVLCDAPCSGSGSWRRAPEGKWSLTEEKLQKLCDTQAEILNAAAELTSPDGILAYATCSMLREENAQQINRFLQQHSDWKLVEQKSWLVQNGTDGFFATHLTRDTADH